MGRNGVLSHRGATSPASAGWPRWVCPSANEATYQVGPAGGTPTGVMSNHHDPRIRLGTDRRHARWPRSSGARRMETRVAAGTGVTCRRHPRADGLRRSGLAAQTVRVMGCVRARHELVLPVRNQC